MAMNNDHFHTHDNFKIAGKIIDQVSALKQRNAELEKENAALKENPAPPFWRISESLCLKEMLLIVASP